MEDLTFSEFAKVIGIPRTTLYTKLNHLKKNDVAKYDYFVLQSEDTLKIRHERIEELKGFLQAEYKPAGNKVSEKQQGQQLFEEVQQLKEALRLSEARYEQLFRQYTSLNESVQSTNNRLMTVIEELTQYIKQSSEKTTQYPQSSLDNQRINRSKIILEDDVEEEPSKEENRFRNRFFKS